jgi:hypothetical protein
MKTKVKAPKLAGLKPYDIYLKGLNEGKSQGVSIGIEFCDMMHSVNIYNQIDKLAEDEEIQKQIAAILDDGFADLLLQLAEDVQFVEYLVKKTPEVREKMGLSAKKFVHTGVMK